RATAPDALTTVIPGYYCKHAQQEHAYRQLPEGINPHLYRMNVPGGKVYQCRFSSGQLSANFGILPVEVCANQTPITGLFKHLVIADKICVTEAFVHS
ncbi:hypothetical protein BaRGS_00000438, partial [Batillaria attramentaria]